MTVGMSQRNFMPVTVDAREDRVAAAAASLYVKSFALSFGRKARTIRVTATG